MTIVARFYPNGEYTQGVDTSHKRTDKRGDKPMQASPSQECRDRYLQWVSMQMSANADIHLCIPGMEFVGKNGVLFTFLYKDEQGYHYACEGKDYVLEDVLVNEPPGRSVGNGDLTPIGLSDARILNQAPKSRKKLESMTTRMARNIRNACFLLEETYGKDVLSFLTLTLPSLSKEDLGKCSEEWDRLVHQFLMWLRRRLEKQNIPFEYVYCTEIQTKRIQKYGDYAPHLHIVFRGRLGRKSVWAVTPKMVRKAWVQCLKSVLGHDNFQSSALENLQRLRKSACRYLAKYMSKGTTSLDKRDAGSVVCAKLKTQWGGMSRNLCKRIKSASQVLRAVGEEGCLVTLFFASIPKLLERKLLSYHRQHIVEIRPRDDSSPVVGIKVSCGALSTPTYRGGLVKCFEYLVNA